MEAQEMQQRLNALDQRLDAIERMVHNVSERQDAMPALPKTNLLSGSFLTRAFAVLGHYLVAGLIIVLPIYLIIFIVFLIASVTLMG
jgi:tetrahydromethanopterin S-methyltransferase subunit B